MGITDTRITPESVEREVERHFRWNFTVNTLDGASFWLGLSFFSSSVILPLYVSHFTSNPLIIGLIPFINMAGVLVPQIFTANAVERAPRKKFFPVNLGFFLERLPLLLMAPAALMFATAQPQVALALFFILYAWHNVGAGITLVGWQDMIAKIIPVKYRGRFYGISTFIGNGSGIVGALLVPAVLSKNAFPNGFAIAFGIAAGLILLSWVFLTLTREPAVPSNKPPVSQLEYLRSLPEVLKRDKNFRLYLLTQIVFSMSSMSSGFLAVYAVQRWSLPDVQASRFTILFQVGLALANLLLGFLADRKGHKASLEISFLLSVAAVVLAVVAGNPLWFFLVFFLRGAVNAGNFVSGISIVYEFSEAEKRPTYIGMANTLPGVAGALAPLIGGWLAGMLGYQVMFIIAAAFGVLGWLLLRFAVREPRRVMVQPGISSESMSR